VRNRYRAGRLTGNTESRAGYRRRPKKEAAFDIDPLADADHVAALDAGVQDPAVGRAG